MDTKLYWTMCGPKNGWGLDYVLQTLLMSVGSIVNLLNEGTYMSSQKKRESSLRYCDKTFMQAFENDEAEGYGFNPKLSIISYKSSV